MKWIVVGLIILAACSSEIAVVPAGDVLVTSTGFDIVALTISPGTVVSVMNADDLPHMLVLNDNNLFEEPIKPAQSAELNFNDPGVYHVLDATSRSTLIVTVE